MSFTPCVCVRCRVDNSNSSSLKRVVKSFGMHCTVLFFVHITKEKNTVLRPAAQLYGQVPTDWNQCFVIDCSVSHSAGHKPFTCSHSVVRNTWLNIHAIRWMRFSADNTKRRAGGTGGLEGCVAKWKTWIFRRLSSCTEGRTGRLPHRMGKWAAH